MSAAGPSPDGAGSRDDEARPRAVGPAEDLHREVWAGVVPVIESLGVPEPDPALRFDLPAPQW